MEKHLLFTNIKACDSLTKKFFLKVSFVFLLSLCSINFASAQSLKEYNMLLSEMSASSDEDIQLQGSRLQELATTLQPTVYVGNQIKAFGGGAPVCADVMGSFISKLYAENQLYNSVELLTIKIDQSGLAAPINLSSLSSFPKLKYIRIICEFSCSASQLESMLTGTNTGLVICYLVSLPE